MKHCAMARSARWQIAVQARSRCCQLSFVQRMRTWSANMSRRCRLSSLRVLGRKCNRGEMTTKVVAIEIDQSVVPASTPQATLSPETIPCMTALVNYDPERLTSRAYNLVKEKECRTCYERYNFAASETAMMSCLKSYSIQSDGTSDLAVLPPSHAGDTKGLDTT